MDKISALLRIDALAGLPRAVVDELVAETGLQRIGRGSTIFREGERAHFVYGVVEGRVSLVSGSESGDTIPDFVEAGEIVLLPAALLDLPYMVSGRAVTDLLVVMIPAAYFRHLAMTQLPLAVELNRVLSRNWRLLLHHLKQAKTRDADTRVVQYLLDHVPPGSDTARIRLPGSKRELAAHLGMTPETLSRALKRLGEIGIETKGTEVSIASIARLSDFARGARPAHFPSTAHAR